MKSIQFSAARRRDIVTVLWIPATALGWSVGLLPSRIGTIGSPIEFTRAFLILSLNGLFVGVVMGILQRLLLRHLISETRGWLLATILGSILAEALGLFLSVAIPWSIFALHGVNTLSGTDGWEFMPVPLYIIFGGFMPGLFQSFILRRAIMKSQTKVALLWILGTWIGVSCGAFAGGWVEGILTNSDVPNVVGILIERVMTGIVLGLVTSSLLFLIRPYQKVDKSYDSGDPITIETTALP